MILSWNNYYGSVCNWWFSIFIIISMFLSCSAIIRKTFPFLSIYYLPIYSINHLFIATWTLEYLFYSVDHNLLLSFLIFLLKLSQIWELHQVSLHHLTMFSSCFWALPYLLVCSKFSLYFLCPCRVISHLFKYAWFLFVGE